MAAGVTINLSCKAGEHVPRKGRVPAWTVPPQAHPHRTNNTRTPTQQSAQHPHNQHTPSSKVEFGEFRFGSPRIYSTVPELHISFGMRVTGRLPANSHSSFRQTKRDLISPKLINRICTTVPLEMHSSRYRLAEPTMRAAARMH